MGFFPLYRENLLTGPSHVSFSLPGVPSQISKSVGATSSALLLVPNIDFLQEFTKGNLGISDNIWKNSLFSNINSNASSTQESVFRKFSEINNLGLTDLNKYKKDGKFKLPLSEVNLSSQSDGLGLKAFEKTTIQSIFETQKPYMEIAKTMLSLLVDVEDVVARVMPLASANPLRHKSEKPSVNSGDSGTKAIGFGNGMAINEALSKLDLISKQGGSIIVNKDGTITKNTQNNITNDIQNGVDSNSTSLNYKIINVVYSTGIYDPKINYQYTYIDLPPDPSAPVIPTPEDDTTDPYDKWKPTNLVFGIFNSKGIPVNPDELLKTIGYSGNQKIEIVTPYKRADWLTNSKKWKFKSGDYIWPTFGTPNFVFTNGLVDKVDKSAPATSGPVPSYTLKKYKSGDKNLLTNSDANPGDPIIDSFDSVDKNSYLKYLTEYTNTNLKLTNELDSSEQIEASKTIMSQLNIDSHLQNVYLYGQNKSSVYKDVNSQPAFPDNMKLSFQPYQIYVPESKSDVKLKDLNGMIWIDPESDYDMKIIRIDPVTKIKSDNVKNESNLTTTIKSFVKNKWTSQLSDNSKFNIDITKNGVKYDSQKDITSYTLDNWNYENNSIINTNIFSYKISNDKVSFSGDLSITNLPVIGKEKIVTLDTNNVVENDIPLYQLNVIDSNNPYGSIIDPSKINNSDLSKDSLFSNGKYGIGDSGNPQEIEILQRYQMTDLDTESYYIIEGVRVDKNKQDGDNTPGNGKSTITNDDSGSKWYRLPHAVGAITVFIKLLIKIFSKLIPSINKLINLFKSPINFITDIITEKLGESFTFLSQSAFKSFNSVSELVKKREDIFSKEGAASYVNKVKEQFSNSPLKNFMFVNEFGSKVSNMSTNLVNNSTTIANNLTGQATTIGTNLFNQGTAIANNLTGQATTIGTNLVNKTSTSINNGLSNADKMISNNLNANKLIPPILKEVSGSGDFKNILDGIGFIPFSIFGKDLSFGMELKMNNLLNKGVPLNLMFNGSKKSQDINGQNNKQSNIPDESKNNSDLTNPNQFDKKFTNLFSKFTGSNTKLNNIEQPVIYSTGQFLNGVDYNYIYITQDTNQLLKEVSDLENSNNPNDVLLAKEKLENALKTDSTNQLLIDKLKEVKSKLYDLASNTQPILKLILSLVTMPVKIIADVVKYIMDFFKSLTNPLALPSKITEFLSFKWIMDFFSAKGILGILGINFNPSLISNWVSMATMTNPLKGGFLYADDFELADLSKYFSASFIPPLPTYTAGHIREMIKNKSNFPTKLFSPIICFIEKIVNGFIDFIWSTLGIELAIKPPHIKLCSDPLTSNPEDIQKILNGQSPNSSSVDNNVTEVTNTSPFETKSSTDSFLYEVKLPDGTLKTFLDRDSLDQFINENKDINFDMEF